MVASLHELLRPITLTKVISQIAASSQSLLRWMQMGPGQSLELSMGHGREGFYHVFNNVRTVGLGRAPGTAAARRARNPIGRVPFVYPRMHEQTSLLAEEIHNLGRIGDPGARDTAGQEYIRRQATPPAQRLANFRTAMVVGMLRDSLYVHESGDNWYFSYTSSGSLFQIAYQMPAANKTQLDMLGAGNIIDVSWDNPSADIPLHLGNINKAFQQLYGGRLEHVHCTFAVWNYITNNDIVAAGHGIANPPFQTFVRALGTGPDGTPINEYVGTINKAPGVTFHISDDGIELGAPGSETWTRHWEDTTAVFMGTPTSDLYNMMLGSEPIAEYDNAPWEVKTGAASWSTRAFNPTSYQLFTLDNALPVAYVPKATAYGTVVF